MNIAPNPNRTENTLPLLEAELDAHEKKRARIKCWLSIVWILGIISGCAWMTLRIVWRRYLAATFPIVLWGMAVVIYMQLWKMPFKFSVPPILTSERDAIEEALNNTLGDRSAIKAVLLFMSPWLMYLVLLLWFALPRTIQVWRQ